jgi:hypothetical protein
VEGSELGLDGRCSCGRWLAAAAIYSYRSRTDRYVFHRCECGNEWTERHIDIDPTQAVSSDEVIEVHTHLAKFAGSIFELFRHPSH